MKSDTMWWKTNFEMVQELRQYDIACRRYSLLIGNGKVVKSTHQEDVGMDLSDQPRATAALPPVPVE